MPQRDSCAKRACPAPVSQGAGPPSLENSGCRRFRRNPHNHVAVALPRTAKRTQPVDHVRLEPDQALDLLVERVLVAHGPERQRFGYRLERGLSDRDADHCGARFTDLVAR
jgi:hypothetical protein